MPKSLTIVLVVLVALVAGSEFIVPWVVRQAMQQGIMALTGSNAVEVQVEEHPSLAMLRGQFDKISVHATDVKTDKILLHDFRADLTGVQVDMGVLFSRRTLALRSARDITLSAVVTQDDLASCLNRAVKDLRDTKVVITPASIRASSTLSFHGLVNVSATLDGKLASDGNEVVFVTNQVSLGNGSFDHIGGSIAGKIPLLDSHKLPFSVKVHEVTQEQGRIVIKADNH